jgi:hypothetical protein
MGGSMNNKTLLIAVIVVQVFISCSDNGNFSNQEIRRIRINAISARTSGSQISLYADIRLEYSDSSTYIPLDSIKDYVIDCFWVINNDLIRSTRNPHRVGYGEHFVKLVLIDFYGDTISDSLSIRTNEPLKIELLSPIEGFSNFSKEDTLKFRYKVSGVDKWEQMQSFLYVSTDEDSLWEEKNIRDSILEPPHTDIYYWGVKAWTEQDAAIYSEIRCIGKFCNGD